MNEIWKDIQGYENEYAVNSKGEVKSKQRIKSNKWNEFTKPAQMLKGRMTKKGYLTVVLYQKGKPKTFPIHRLVAQTFIPNPENKPQVNHINGIKTDNRVENLEWVTNEENRIHAVQNGFVAKPNPRKGEDTYNHKLSKEDVEFIRQNYIKGDKNFGGGALGRKFNVSSSLIVLIAKNLRWRVS